MLIRSDAMAPGSTVLVPFAASSVSRVRRELAKELRARGMPDRAVDDATLVLSEILSNALKHARPLPSGRLRLRWRVTSDDVQVEVTDGGAQTRPRASLSTMSATGGRGLSIVATIARDWGVLDEAGTTTVWAVVEQAPRPLGC